VLVFGASRALDFSCFVRLLLLPVAPLAEAFRAPFVGALLLSARAAALVERAAGMRFALPVVAATVAALMNHTAATRHVPSGTCQAVSSSGGGSGSSSSTEAQPCVGTISRISIQVQATVRVCQRAGHEDPDLLFGTQICCFVDPGTVPVGE
jgi:hypothetical protein